MSRTTVGEPPAQVDLIVYAGDDYAVEVGVFDPGGAAADLTGYTAAAQVRPSPPADLVLVEFAATITGNVVTLILTHDQTALFERDASWDVQITSAGAIVTTLAYGAVRVIREVTRYAAA
jgi:hypothetical protein